MTYIRQLTIAPGGWLLLALLYFFLDLRVLLVVMCAAAVHEAGHLFMLRRYRVELRSICLDMSGLCIRCGRGCLTPRAQFMIAAGGPLLGLLVSGGASVLGNLAQSRTLLLFAGAGAALSVFNLLPAPPLDGWRMLRAMCPRRADAVGTLAAVGVLIAGLGAMYRGWGTALALMGILLLLRKGAVGEF